MNTMKEVKIIQSKTEPNKNHLWLSDEGLKQFKGNGWEQVLSNDNGGSGGSSIDPNDENYVEYLDISNIEGWDHLVIPLRMMATLKNVVAEQNGIVGVFILPTYVENVMEGEGILTNIQDRYLEIYPNKKFTQSNPTTNVFELKSLIQQFIESETTIPQGSGILEQYKNIPRITKEQFYNLNE